jgi:hypothetical protein
MRLEEALAQVRVVRQQLVRTERYCCYRWATVAGSSLLALTAAAGQDTWVGEPHRAVERYLAWWVAVALVSFLLIAAELLSRWWLTGGHYSRRQTVLALTQFGPCLIVGVGLTWTAWTSGDYQLCRLLPGLWSIVFGLGIVASTPYLPPSTWWVAAYYLLAGLFVWSQSAGPAALQPWTMGLTFGIGQALAAIVLYRHEELRCEQADSQ